MQTDKLTKKQFIELATQIVLALGVLLVAFGLLKPDAAAPTDNEATARGVTNFDSLTLSQDLIVGDDLDVAGDTTFGTGNLSPLLTADTNEAVFTASYTFTGTKVITSLLHGFETGVTSAFCTLAETPATGSGDGALCWVGIGATQNVTVTVEQDDWTTNAANSTAVYVGVVGTP